MDACDIIEEYKEYLLNKDFPCVAARAAVSRQQIKFLVVEHLACPKDDIAILNFLYSFVDTYRASTELFHSAAVIFKGPEMANEALFDTLLWQRLQSLANLDAQQYGFDQRVNSDPNSPDFSFSLKEEAFFIIGLHPGSSRRARQFRYPTLVFNPHAQFEQMRQKDQYGKMQNIVRKRDESYAGSINPMLKDFGTASEVYQYSGRQYDQSWQCPLQINHATAKHYTAA
ncbi:guanitoxin biosynthesis heme-dependent pre-guanitoxin N-hydroxylase GntA [Adhaeribacter rhizoryzae]|uniref:YqcI/YcgG family protein n=1 Tax=Adhaeribacter rhizoryzae TaxID=2607907 RepID=A0A5M6DCC4_9BACT|nr:guanitoxin biosynthesis heme-dependent pre-guanitoxin N-hydroxylase GntA [Adhaeribacter rhizoryzae]KAA5545023.1 YqcI/YcgG family protein [Adhaeribacter rhizoryzae]